MIARRANHLVPRRVLIVKPSALGDVVTAVPVLRALKRTYPQVHTAWLVSDACAPLIAHDSQLDEAVPFERRRLGRAWRSRSGARTLWRLLRSLRRGEYDWVIDLQGLLRSGLLTAATRAPLRAGFAEGREGSWLFYTRPVSVTAQHTVQRNLDLAAVLGLDARGDDMTLEISQTARAFAKRFRQQAGLAEGGYVACVPRTRWQSKQYPARHWRRAVATLREDIPIVLLGSDGDRDMCAHIADGQTGVVDLAGQTSVAEMVAVIAGAAGVLCRDSAAKFIAPAVGVDVVTLSGPTKTERTGPYRMGRAVVADVACQGCLKRRCRPAMCMEMIDPGHVVDATRQMLRG